MIRSDLATFGPTSINLGFDVFEDSFENGIDFLNMSEISRSDVQFTHLRFQITSIPSRLIDGSIRKNSFSKRVENEACNFANRWRWCIYADFLKNEEAELSKSMLEDRS